MIIRNNRAKSSYGNTSINYPQQFNPFGDQTEQIKLNDLRHKRKQLQAKLKMVSNRINYKKKKEQDQLRKMMRSQQQIRTMSQTKTFKKFNQIMRQQLTQKNLFENRKKAKQVQDFRLTNLKRLSLINQALKDRRIFQSQKIRKAKKIDQEVIQFSKQQALQNKKQKREHIIKLRQRQQVRKKCFWIQKKISYEQQLANEAQIYEKQIQDYYRKIEKMRVQQEQLKEQQQKAAQALKSAQQNYSLLRQS